MKKVISCLIVFALLLSCFSTAAFAATSKKLDLAFVIDTTGSMSDDISQVKNDMEAYLNNLQSSDTDYRIAIVDYRDFPGRTGDSRDYPYHVQLDFTNVYSTIDASITALSLGNGGDGNETIYSALIDGLDALSWRKDASKAVILMGDAPALDPEPTTGYTLDDAIERLGGSGIELTEPDEIKSIVLFAVAPSASSETISFFQQLATATGGKCYSASSASQISDIIDQILSIDIPEISHVFSDWVIETEPTCETAGTETRSCSHCDLVETVELAPLGHNEQTYTEDPTCTDIGYEIVICLRCGKTLKREIVPMLEHDWDAGFCVKEPTCTEKGVIVYTCNTCGATKNEPTDLLAHRWNEGEITKVPTCTEAGEKTYTCSVGGETRTEPVDKLDHNIVLVPGVAPTCTASGFTDGWKCASCGKWFAEQQEIPETGHEWSGWWVSEIKEHDYATIEYECIHEGCGARCSETAELFICDHREPTCEDYGWNEYAAQFEDEHIGMVWLEWEEIPPLGHSFSEEWTLIQEATCTQTGRKARVCEICGAETDVVVIAQLPHKVAPGKEATCQSAAVCDLCGQAFGDRNPNNHPSDQIRMIQTAVEPTCGASGRKAILYCRACDKIIQSAEEIPATDNHVMKTAPTCTKKATCAVCGREYGEINPNAHTLKKHDAVTANCVDKGVQAYWACTECKKLFSDAEGQNAIFKVEETAVDMTNHKNLKAVAQKAATCKEEGNIAYWFCNGCNKYYSDKDATIEIKQADTRIAKIAHDWGDWVYPADFNCAVGGTVTRECKACKEKETKTTKPGEHVELVTEKAALPTCTNAGKTEKIYCGKCGTVLMDAKEVPALGHDYTGAKAVAIGTDTHSFECTRCKQMGDLQPCRDADQDGFCDFCTNAVTSSPDPQPQDEAPQGFFAKIGAFFKNLFDKLFGVFNR